MVPPCSDRITRVPPYSSSVIDFAFHVRGYHPLWPDFPDRSTRRHRLVPTGLFRVRSPLLAESRLISVPPGTEMFQFPGFASHAYLFSVRYGRSRGFPHSDIPGSKLVCQLPETFRRLLRPSSPPTAKASTTYASSLDHITPIGLGCGRRAGISLRMRHACDSQVEST
jgi:hypothetical protein